MLGFGKSPITMSTRQKDERRERFETPSGVDLPADFNPSNTDPLDYENDLGSPGAFPYTRGIYQNMYRGRLWTMRQYAGYATAEESNAQGGVLPSNPILERSATTA